MTRERHPTVSAIAPKIELAVKLVHIMPLMTVEHARHTETMWLNDLCERKLPLCVRLTDQETFLPLLLDHFFITCLARKYLLVNIAVFISTLLLYILYQTGLDNIFTYCSAQAAP